ncbi:Ketosteroid isomerase homolog [Rhizobiales bacterium GAS191]|nr:Ketosteroid isomerase homolog [Rhizobiales bacterium GAS191]
MNDTSADRRAIDAVNRQFEAAVAKGDVPAAVKAYTKDGRVMPPDAPMAQGHAALEAFWSATAQQLGVKSVKLETIDLTILGDTAIEIGRARIETGNGVAVAKFVVVWKKVTEGWRWHVDIFNMDPST